MLNLVLIRNANELWNKFKKDMESQTAALYMVPDNEEWPKHFKNKEDLKSVSFPVVIQTTYDYDADVIVAHKILNQKEFSEIKTKLNKLLLEVVVPYTSIMEKRNEG